jgi:hypothetical protein
MGAGYQPKKQQGTPVPPPNRNGMTREEKLNEPAEVLAAAELVRDYCKGRHCIDGCVFQRWANGSVRCKLKDDEDNKIYPAAWDLRTAQE